MPAGKPLGSRVEDEIILRERWLGADLGASGAAIQPVTLARAPAQVEPERRGAVGQFAGIELPREALEHDVGVEVRRGELDPFLTPLAERGADRSQSTPRLGQVIHVSPFADRSPLHHSVVLEYA